MQERSNQQSILSELTFEYDQLRKEILQNDTLTLQILTIILLLSSALMGFAFSQQLSNGGKSALFFLVEVVALIGLYQNTEIIKSTYIIASYIRTFIEPQTSEIKWETRLLQFFKESSDYKKGGSLITHQRLVYTIIIFVNFCLGSYYFVEAYSTVLSNKII